MRWLDGITNATDMNLSALQDTVKEREDECAVIHGVAKNRTWWVAEQQQAKVCSLQSRLKQ